MIVVLPEGIVKEISSHMREDFPNEACGFLFGRRNKEWTVTAIRKATNLLKSPSLFEIPAEEIYNAWMDAEKVGMDVIGVYHSHPYAAPYPSGRDLEFMRNSDFVWIIAGSDELKAYYWKGEILEIKIDIRDMKWEWI